MEAKLTGQLNVRDTDESFDCCVTGLTSISRDVIVIADYYNNSIKVINVSKKSISKTQLALVAPWDVAAIDSKTVATTLPKRGHVVFLNVNDHPASEQNCFDVGKGCWGIDHNNGVIAVSFSSAILLLDMQGKVLNKFSIKHELNSHSYICLSNDNNNIFLSDTENHTIHQLTKDGHHKEAVHYGDLKSPAGMVILLNGNIAVCGIGNSDRLTVVTPSINHFTSLLLENIHKPCCISLGREITDNTCVMYVSEDTSSVDRNLIKVYELRH